MEVFMKLQFLAVLLLAGAVGLFAQNGPDPFGGGGGERGQGGPGGFGPQVTWKQGVSVLQEFKAGTGSLTAGANNAWVLKLGNTEYQLFFPATAEQSGMKSGDKVTVEGIATTVKGQDVKPTYRILKLTVNGKAVDLTQFMRRRGDD
jgi:hypothetical protein